MMATQPGEETARLAALERYRILDTEPERAFDDLVVIAAQICGTPIAFIGLIDADRQWFKARVGLSMSEVARTMSFCSAQTIKQSGVIVVPSAQQDDRLRESPLVTGEPHIRFYAGASLVTPDGHVLGTLCVVDQVERTLTPGQLEALEALKHQAEAQLELRRNLIELHDALAARDRAEADQAALTNELQVALGDVKKLSALIPYCSECQFDMTIPADPRAIPTITDGIRELLKSRGWTEHDIMAVELAVQEAVANAIRHGCRNDPTNNVQCCVTVDSTGEVMVVVRDPGAGFDHTALANPLDPENMLKPSGRGIFLINGLMDRVGFADGGRELQMRKRKA